VADRDTEALLGTSNFRVLIGDRELGFCEIGRMTSATSDEPERPAQRFEPLLLRRALTRSTELYEWRRAVAAGKDDRRDVTIQQLDAAAGEVANSWRLVRAWPLRWSGPAFNALETGIAYEELELAFDDLTWNEQGA
jgi:phage tail-like protein